MGRRTFKERIRRFKEAHRTFWRILVGVVKYALLSVLLAAMPAPATTSMLSSKYDCAPDFATKMVITSTLCSIPTIFVWGLLLKASG